jgi:hypothetical protein
MIRPVGRNTKHIGNFLEGELQKDSRLGLFSLSRVFA